MEKSGKNAESGIKRSNERTRKKEREEDQTSATKHKVKGRPKERLQETE